MRSSANRYTVKVSGAKRHCLSLLIAIALSSNVNAQQQQPQVQYSVPAGDMVRVVNDISQGSGIQIVYDIDLLEGLSSGGVKGTLTLKQALDQALSGSGIQWDQVNPTTVALKPKRPAVSEETPKIAPNAARAKTSDDEVADLEKLVVVGSRLGALNPAESSLPIKVISRAEIERTGASSIAGVLAYLPEVSVNNVGDTSIGSVGAELGGNAINATTVQLRGLPIGTTLVLVNGRRSGGSAVFSESVFDLSTIPVSMVERIEVMTAGASAVYGGDGLGGVVNIVLRKDGDGTEISVRGSYADGYHETQANLTHFSAWSKGRLVSSISWKRNGTLSASERSITANRDYSRFGGSDYRTTSSYPGNVISLAGCSPFPPDYCLMVPVGSRGNLPGLDSPIASIPVGQDGLGLSPDDFTATQGVRNLVSRESQIISPEESLGINLSGSIYPQGGFEIFGELTYNQRRVDAIEIPIEVWGSEYGVWGVVSASNPFNPFGVDVGVDYQYKDTNVYRSYTNEHIRALMGAKGNIRKWGWEVSIWGSEDESDTGSIGYFDQGGDAFNEALRAQNPSAAFNPFSGNNDAPASQELINSFYTTIEDQYNLRMNGVSGFIRGPLASLPAGELVGLLGAEYEETKWLFDPASSDESVHVNTSDSSRAIFAEVRAPLVRSEKPGERETLSVTGAIRRETSARYDRAALTTGFGLEFRPRDNLLLRTNYSTAFKPIGMWRSGQAPQYSQAIVRDPMFDGSTFIVPMLWSGGIPDGLEPETSKTITTGFVYTPNDSIRAAASYWATSLNDRFSFVSAQFILDNESNYEGRVSRNGGAGIVELIDARQINVASTDIAGVDIAFDAGWDTAVGRIEASLAASYTYKYEEKLTASSPATDYVSRYNRTGWAPRWKISPRMVADLGDHVRVNAHGRYISSYTDPMPLSTGTIVDAGDFWVFDVGLEMKAGRWLALFDDVSVGVGARNVFNKLPEFCPSCGESGYDASQYDIQGRTIFVTIRSSF